MNKLPIENPHLPANHQNAGADPLSNVKPVKRPTVNLGGQGYSPVPEIKRMPEGINFIEALSEMMDRKLLTRLEWNDEQTYCSVKTEKLMIHNSIDGKWHDWVVSLGDLLGEDWAIL